MKTTRKSNLFILVRNLLMIICSQMIKNNEKDTFNDILKKVSFGHILNKIY